MGDLAFAAKHGANHVAQRLSYRLDRRLCRPTQINVLITEACAARCTMCDIWKRTVGDEMSVDEWRPVLDRLRAWLGPFFLVMSGGEPFQKPGFFDLLAHCRAIGIKTKVSTNGMFLTPRLCERILETGPDFLSFSIDHHDPEVHDALRGVPLHARCVRAIECLRGNGAGIVLGVATVVMEETYRALADTGRWALDLGVDRVLYQPLYPTFGSGEGMDAQWFRRNPHWPRDADGVGAAIDELRRLKASGLPIWNADAQLDAMRYYFRDPATHPRPDECMVRYNVFNIDARGDVTFCYTVDDRVGSVRTSHPRAIWESSRADEVRARMRTCTAPCLLNCYRGRTLREQVALFRLFASRQGF